MTISNQFGFSDLYSHQKLVAEAPISASTAYSTLPILQNACANADRATDYPTNYPMLPANSQRSATENYARRQLETIVGYISGTRKPDPVAILVFDAVLESLAKWPKPKRLAHDEPVERSAEDQGMPFRLLEHLFELIHQHIRELTAGMSAMDKRARVVELERIWNRQDRA